MNIKYLAIALLSTALLSSPVFAYKDKVKPSTVTKEMDKASPQMKGVETEDIGREQANPLDEDGIDKSDDQLDKTSSIGGGTGSGLGSIKAREKGSGMATGKRTHSPAASSHPTQSTKSAASPKIGDIQGESTRSADNEVRVNRIEMAIAAPNPDGSDDEDNDCDDIKENGTKEQLETCHRGHVTVLK